QSTVADCLKRHSDYEYSRFLDGHRRRQYGRASKNLGHAQIRLNYHFELTNVYALSVYPTIFRQGSNDWLCKGLTYKSSRKENETIHKCSISIVDAIRIDCLRAKRKRYTNSSPDKHGDNRRHIGRRQLGSKR